MIDLDTDQIRINADKCLQLPSVTDHYDFTRPRPNFETFQNLEADVTDPADTIRTVRDSADAIRTITDRTDRYGRAVRSIRRVRMCVCDQGITWGEMIGLFD